MATLALVLAKRSFRKDVSLTTQYRISSRNSPAHDKHDLPPFTVARTSEIRSVTLAVLNTVTVLLIADDNVLICGLSSEALKSAIQLHDESTGPQTHISEFSKNCAFFIDPDYPCVAR